MYGSCDTHVLFSSSFFSGRICDNRVVFCLDDRRIDFMVESQIIIENKFAMKIRIKNVTGSISNEGLLWELKSDAGVQPGDIIEDGRYNPNNNSVEFSRHSVNCVAWLGETCEKVEQESTMRIVEDKSNTLLIINEVKCVVQSYEKDVFVNLSPVQTGKESFEERLDNIRIDFINHRISTEGKENIKWKEFASILEIDEINNVLKTK